jgi:hypothetical protein
MDQNRVDKLIVSRIGVEPISSHEVTLGKCEDE